MRPPWHHVGLAVVLAAAVAIEAWAAHLAPTTVLADAAAALSLAWVSVHPTAVAAAVLAAYASVPDATEPVLSILPYLVSLAFVGRYSSRRAGVAVVVASALVLGLRDLDAAKSVSHLAGNLVYYSLFSAVIVLGGQLLKYGERRERELATVARELDAEAGERERMAVEAERGHIARELHDVVAQALTMIGVHAAVARSALPSDATVAARSLEVVDAAAESAAVDMRRLLGLLREHPERSEPTPSLRGLDDLAAQANAAGLIVEVTSDLREPTPPALELTAHRIVQEALTNARRHAPGSAVDVLVRAAEGQLKIVVEDSGPAAAPTAELQATAPRGSGLGLIGLRERAAIYGGCLQTSRTARGGFRLEAVFPVGGPLNPGPLPQKR